MFKIFFFLFLFLLLLFPAKISAKEPAFLLINQIRGEEKCCENGSLTLIENLTKAKDIQGLSFAWALRFDALEDDRYINALKGFGELGLLLEVTPNLASKSGVLYKGSKTGNDWYLAKNAFLVGYSQKERKKILDTLFDFFKKRLGFYPSFTVSWMIDVWSLNYIHDNYQVKLHELTKEQYETDSYTLYGGIFNAPYYPSKNHPLIPGQSENKLDTVVVRQTISDLLLNYGVLKAYYTSQPNDYLENPEKKDILYFQNLIKDTLNQSMGLRFGVLGFENSYSLDKFAEEYLKQLKVTAKMQKEGKLRTVFPSDYASEFRKEYRENPSFYLVKDFTSGKKSGVLWYFGKTYRARVLLKDKKLILNDLRIFGDFDDPYKAKPAETDYSYWIIPYLIDGSQQYSKTPRRVVRQLAELLRGGGINKESGPPGGSLTSDTLTSPFGIILGEGKFTFNTEKQDIAEIEFTGDRKGIARFLPEEILIDKSLKPSFSEPYLITIDELFNKQEETNMQFNREFEFSIKPVSFRAEGGTVWYLPKSRNLTPPKHWNVEDPSTPPIKSGSVGMTMLHLGWQRDGKFISFAVIYKEKNQLTMIPRVEENDLTFLDPMFKPDRSGLSADFQKSVFYWNNRQAVAGRNPVRLFILPLNGLSRPVGIKNVKITAVSCRFTVDPGSSDKLKQNQNIRKCADSLSLVYPDDYSYRVTPWFIDISSSNPLKTEVMVIADGKEVIKDISVEFVIDCQKNIQDCLKKPSQLTKYILVLLNEQKMKLLVYLKNLRK